MLNSALRAHHRSVVPSFRLSVPLRPLYPPPAHRLSSRRPRPARERSPILTAESTRTRGPQAEGALAAPATLGVPDALAWRSINAIRALAMDAVEAAQSGHPGTPMA